jgi:hypothetical protein
VKIGKRLLAMKEQKNIRNNTVLRSSISVLQNQVDNDKKLFLQEFVKLLAYSDMYFKQRQFTAFYNAALTLTFMAV